MNTAYCTEEAMWKDVAGVLYYRYQHHVLVLLLLANHWNAGHIAASGNDKYKIQFQVCECVCMYI